MENLEMRQENESVVALTEQELEDVTGGSGQFHARFSGIRATYRNERDGNVGRFPATMTALIDGPSAGLHRRTNGVRGSKAILENMRKESAELRKPRPMIKV